MAVVAVCTHCVRGFGKGPNINAECYCGWRMGELTKQGFNDAGHLHYAMEGLTPIVHILPTDDNEDAWGWAASNLEHIIYEGKSDVRDFKCA